MAVAASSVKYLQAYVRGKVRLLVSATVQGPPQYCEGMPFAIAEPDLVQNLQWYVVMEMTHAHVGVCPNRPKLRSVHL